MKAQKAKVLEYFGSIRLLVSDDKKNKLIKISTDKKIKEGQLEQALSKHNIKITEQAYLGLSKTPYESLSDKEQNMVDTKELERTNTTIQNLTISNIGLGVLSTSAILVASTYAYAYASDMKDPAEALIGGTISVGTAVVGAIIFNKQAKEIDILKEDREKLLLRKLNK